ncbi:MAG: DUF262 domain-containing protein [Chloroflexi bacterium]|nr:DUF262 domain-containing protein [Chloroflexota bacterium]MYF23022.1 DUF262 domain-containing protein [Chloroflexota bacterium]
MDQTVFQQVTFTLSGLLQQISTGQIGLPDIQRPFVWKNVKVRDLLDSMYRGYPVGYLLLWQTGVEPTHRTIGGQQKQVAPSLVIVDGQQRLTSLFAVFSGEEVVRNDFSRERIRIAFNPLNGRFDVASAATDNDRSFIPDVTPLLSGNRNLIATFNDYVTRLESARSVSDAEKRTAEEALGRLQALSNFPLTALQLANHVEEEDVAEVFVRINSKGKPLNQADFILTLMSVFWDQGRTALEEFARRSKQPDTSASSPFNHFIEPTPDRLLRVGVGLAFRRARLEYVYSILRGKDPDTGEFSEDLRDQQFKRLQAAQEKALNLTNWHDFLQCLTQAGYRNRRMVNSETALFFAYTLYLIGRSELKVQAKPLRTAVAQWFFMSSLTGRYTGSPESAMESDLAMIRSAETAESFLATLQKACDIALTSDFWSVTLPNELATSTARSPSLTAYHAAQVLLQAPVLFSDTKISDWFDPFVNPAKSIERHHLFPKAHLNKLDITARTATNQIANYAYVEWTDNLKIGAAPPEKYLPAFETAMRASGQSDAAIEQMYELHALPTGWQSMAYQDFLRERRQRMAELIRRGFGQIGLQHVSGSASPASLDLVALIAGGESDDVEFKSTLRMNLHSGAKDSRMEDAIVKTVAGFLNLKGGSLVIGVQDDGTPIGIEHDEFESEDKMNLHLTNLLNDRLNPTIWANVHANFEDYGAKRVLTVRCDPSSKPVYDKHGRLFVRTGHATRELSAQEAAEFVQAQFS